MEARNLQEKGQILQFEDCIVEKIKVLQMRRNSPFWENKEQDFARLGEQQFQNQS